MNKSEQIYELMLLGYTETQICKLLSNPIWKEMVSIIIAEKVTVDKLTKKNNQE